MISSFYKMRLNTQILIALCLVFYSCGRIKNKGQELVDKSEQSMSNISENVIEKLVPKFDAFEADTKNNKKRFSDFLQVALSPDVKNIYCFADNIGIDSDYQFSFNCDSSTVRRIIAKHNLTLDNETTDFAFSLQDDFIWWDKKKIAKLKLYSWSGEHEYFKYFWYDASDQKAYFFDFDM